jgi:hypothetical protein
LKVNGTQVLGPQQTGPTYTADDESAAYTGIDNAQTGTPYASLTDLNALRAAYETLRAMCESLLALTGTAGHGLHDA